MRDTVRDIFPEAMRPDVQLLRIQEGYHHTKRPRSAKPEASYVKSPSSRQYRVFLVCAEEVAGAVQEARCRGHPGPLLVGVHWSAEPALRLLS